MDSSLNKRGARSNECRSKERRHKSADKRAP